MIKDLTVYGWLNTVHSITFCLLFRLSRALWLFLVSWLVLHLQSLGKAHLVSCIVWSICVSWGWRNVRVGFPFNANSQTPLSLWRLRNLTLDSWWRALVSRRVSRWFLRCPVARTSNPTWTSRELLGWSVSLRWTNFYSTFLYGRSNIGFLLRLRGCGVRDLGII